MEDIFSQDSLTKTLANTTVPIVIDTREKNSLVPTNLIHMKSNYNFEKLDIGDYLIEDIVIERKTLPDFLSSMISGRLIKQLIEIKKHKTPLLLLEGFYYNYQDYNVHENAIRGMLLSITTGLQIPIIYTQNEKDTARMLISLAKQKEKPKKEPAIRPTKTLQTLDERKQYILEGFSGIGPTKAKELIKEFGTLKNIFNDNIKLVSMLAPNTYIKFKQLIDD